MQESPHGRKIFLREIPISKISSIGNYQLERFLNWIQRLHVLKNQNLITQEGELHSSTLFSHVHMDLNDYTKPPRLNTAYQISFFFYDFSN